MDWIKYFIIKRKKSGIKINSLKQGVHYFNDNNFITYANGKKCGIFSHIHCFKMDVYYILGNWIEGNYNVGNYNNDKLDGYQYTWFKNGQISNITYALNNKLHNKQFAWNARGDIECILNYKNAWRHGIQYQHYNNQLVIKNYIDGIQNGISCLWDKDGSIINLCLYENHKKIKTLCNPYKEEDLLQDLIDAYEYLYK